MSWALKGLAGPLKNKMFTLKPGLTLGRQGDVVVPDTKSSAIHARITQSPKGAWVLSDNSSKNGTRIDGERITSVTLAAGIKFYIGDQGFEVVADLDGKTRPPVLADIIAAAEEQGLPPPPPEKFRAEEPPPKPRRYWHEILAEFVATNQENFSERKTPVSPLSPAIVLEFVRGIQVNSKWVLGYGPRKVGPSVLDLPIWEPGAPAVCFEILPSGDGIMFKTAHAGQVTVNGEALDTRVLHVGDKIQINETIIEVDFEQ